MDIKPLTDKEKQDAVMSVFANVQMILKINGYDLGEFNSNLQNAILMIYQQGLKDAGKMLGVTEKEINETI